MEKGGEACLAVPDRFLDEVHGCVDVGFAYCIPRGQEVADRPVQGDDGWLSHVLWLIGPEVCHTREGIMNAVVKSPSGVMVLRRCAALAEICNII